MVVVALLPISVANPFCAAISYMGILGRNGCFDKSKGKSVFSATFIAASSARMPKRADHCPRLC